MNKQSIIFEAIGVIHSPFQTLEEMPIQPTSQASQAGVVEIYPQFAEGLKDLDGFSHIYLIYYLHQAAPYKLTVTPFLDTQPRGLFATRAPRRPNPIGLSLVELVGIEGRNLRIKNLDILDQTPLLDIKPYIPEFESAQGIRIGWAKQARGKVHNQKSDGRFK
jgi:tRNA-Thr(GGU) m(6)t(6)A37 methyltransferase TsaA